MSNYTRFVSYLYEYKNGTKLENRGFVKVEARDNLCKMEVHIKAPMQPTNVSLKIYGFVRKDSRLPGILLGSCPITRGAVLCNLQFSTENIGNTSYNFQDLSGLLVFGENDICYGTSWDDHSIIVSTFDIMELPPETQAAPHEENVQNEPEPFMEQTDFQEKIPTEELECPEEIIPSDEAESPEDIMLSDESESPEDTMLSDESESPEDTMLSDESEFTKDITLSDGSGFPEDMMLPDESELPEDMMPCNESQFPKDITLSDESGFPEDMMPPNESQFPQDMIPSNHWRSSQDMMPSNQWRSSQDMIPSPKQRFFEENADLCEQRFSPEKVIASEAAPPVEALENSSEMLMAVNNSPSIDDRWQQIQSSYESIKPFQDDEITECIQLDLKDLPRLRKNNWLIGNNQFILHSYSSYHHLVMGKADGSDGPAYMLLIPGTYDPKEKFMANMFGFPYFKPVENRSLQPGQFGYWYRPVN